MYRINIPISLYYQIRIQRHQERRRERIRDRLFKRKSNNPILKSIPEPDGYPFLLHVQPNSSKLSSIPSSSKSNITQDLIPPNTTSSYQKDIPIPGWVSLQNQTRRRTIRSLYSTSGKTYYPPGSDRWRRYIKKQRLEALSEEKHLKRLERIAKKDQLDFEQARYLKTSNTNNVNV
ncbi:hypothetical protein RhiirC2_781159 [Rhizophagus irregularis]|uniref:Uncharacterized protein n=1 Tax=Rhizophagus irregularis TaxID=588596 RepID=A0A2N1N5Z8_9GLOM|nr:hypothetical protein RhiirC2_781159 [Rhizophagus irregularis]